MFISLPAQVLPALIIKTVHSSPFKIGINHVNRTEVKVDRLGSGGGRRPLLVAWVRDTTNSYYQTLIFFSVCFVVSLGVAEFLKFKQKPVIEDKVSEAVSTAP